jgi:hypothetical protein
MDSSELSNEKRLTESIGQPLKEIKETGETYLAWLATLSRSWSHIQGL